jgi:hypothetical protein
MDDFLFLVLGMAGGVLVGMMIVFSIGESHKTIVEKGYGLYCPDNGKFAFTGECQ